MKKAIRLLISAGLLALIGLAALRASRPVRTIQELSQTEFAAKAHSNLIAKVRVSYPPQPPLLLQQARGTFYETDPAGKVLLDKGIPKELLFHASFRMTEDLQRQLLMNTNFTTVEPTPLGTALKRWFRVGR